MKVLALVVAGLFAFEAAFGGFAFTSISAASTASSCTPASYPCSSTMTLSSYSGGDTQAISDLAAGKIASYDFALSPAERSSLASNSAMSFDGTPFGLDGLFLNTEGPVIFSNSTSGTSVFNPFYYEPVRVALNYVMNRQYFVDNILGGAGVPVLTPYNVSPDSLAVANATAPFQNLTTYNFAYANQTIYNTLSTQSSAKLVSGRWYYNGAPVTVYMIYRVDSTFRRQYEGYFASQLQSLGFTVQFVDADLTQAFQILGENPVNGTQPWEIYPLGYGDIFGQYVAEGWACLDGANCAGETYSDNYTGSFNPCASDAICSGYNTLNYTQPILIKQSDQIDPLNQALLTGNYSTVAQRDAVIQQYITLSLQMADFLWLATSLNVVAYNTNLMTGAQIQFATDPILNTESYMTMQSTTSSPLTIGVRHLFEFSPNPVGGYTDTYGSNTAAGENLPIFGYGPSTGIATPMGWTLSVKAMSSTASVSVPTGAVNYSATAGAWQSAAGLTSKSDIVVNFGNLIAHTTFGDGTPVTLSDFLYPYVIASDVANAVKDPSLNEFINDSASPASSYSADLSLIAGLKVLNSTSIELYGNYFFPDPTYAALSTVGDLIPFRNGIAPWQLYVAMADTVGSGKAAWTDNTGVAKGIDWLSLVNPADLANIKSALSTRLGTSFVPAQLTALQTSSGVTLGGLDTTSANAGYTAASTFITNNGNGIIGDGPFYISTFQHSTTPYYAVLTKNPGFALGPYLDPSLFATASVDSVTGTVPTTIHAGSTINLTAISTPVGSTNGTATQGIDVTVQFIGATGIAYQASLVSGTGGAVTITVPATLTPGIYTVNIYSDSSTSSEIIPLSTSVTLLGPATSTTNTSTTTTSSSSSSSSLATTLEIIAAIVVVLVVVGAAVLFMRRRPKAT